MMGGRLFIGAILLYLGGTLVAHAQMSMTIVGASVSPPAGIALVAHNQAVGSTLSTTATTSPTDMHLANFIAIHIVGANANVGPPTDSQGNTYLHVTCVTDNANGCIWFAYAPTVTSSMIFSFTTGNGCSACSIQVGGFSGTIGSSVDQTGTQAVASGVTTCPVPAGVTPGSNNELILYGAQGQTANVSSVDSSMLLVDSSTFTGGQNFGGALYYKVQTTATFIQPTATLSTTAGYTTCQVASFS